jgi:hypothetical protein
MSFLLLLQLNHGPIQRGTGVKNNDNGDQTFVMVLFITVQELNPSTMVAATITTIAATTLT